MDAGEALARLRDARQGPGARRRRQRLLTDIVSLVRFALHRDDELVPFAEQVRERFENWMAQQENAGRQFTDEQRRWLEMMRDHVAASLEIETRRLRLRAIHAGRRPRQGAAGVREELGRSAAGVERGLGGMTIVQRADLPRDGARTSDGTGSARAERADRRPLGSNLKTEHYRDCGPLVIRLQNIGDGDSSMPQRTLTPTHFERLRRSRSQGRAMSRSRS